MAALRWPGHSEQPGAPQEAPYVTWSDHSERPGPLGKTCSHPVWTAGGKGKDGDSSVSSGRLSGSSGGHESCAPPHGPWKERPPEVSGCRRQPRESSSPRLEHLRERIRAQAQGQASCASLATSTAPGALPLHKAPTRAPRRKVQKPKKPPPPAPAHPGFSNLSTAECGVEDKAISGQEPEPSGVSRCQASVPWEKPKSMKSSSCKREKTRKVPPGRAAKDKDSDLGGVYAWRKGQALVKGLLGPPPAPARLQTKAPSREPAPTVQLGDAEKVGIAESSPVRPPMPSPASIRSDPQVRTHTPNLASWDQATTIQSAMAILQDLRQQIQAGLELARDRRFSRGSEHQLPALRRQEPAGRRPRGPWSAPAVRSSLSKSPQSLTKGTHSSLERAGSLSTSQRWSTVPRWDSYPQKTCLAQGQDPTFQRPRSPPERLSYFPQRSRSASAGQRAWVTCEDREAPAGEPWNPLEGPTLPAQRSWSASFPKSAPVSFKGRDSLLPPSGTKGAWPRTPQRTPRMALGKENEMRPPPPCPKPRGFLGHPYSTETLREFMRRKAAARRQQALEEKASATLALELRDQRLQDVYRKQREAVLGKAVPSKAVLGKVVPCKAFPVVSQTTPGIVTFVPHSAQSGDLEASESLGSSGLQWSKVTSGMVLGDQEAPGSFCLCLNRALNRAEALETEGPPGGWKRAPPLLSASSSLGPAKPQDLTTGHPPPGLCIYLDPEEAERLGTRGPLHFRYKQARLQALETMANVLRQRIDVLTAKLHKSRAVDALSDLVSASPPPSCPSTVPEAPVPAAPAWPRALVPNRSGGPPWDWADVPARPLLPPACFPDGEKVLWRPSWEQLRSISPRGHLASRAQGFLEDERLEMDESLPRTTASFLALRPLAGSSFEVPARPDTTCSSLWREETPLAGEAGLVTPWTPWSCGKGGLPDRPWAGWSVRWPGRSDWDSLHCLGFRQDPAAVDRPFSTRGGRRRVQSPDRWAGGNLRPFPHGGSDGLVMRASSPDERVTRRSTETELGMPRTPGLSAASASVASAGPLEPHRPRSQRLADIQQKSLSFLRSLELDQQERGQALALLQQRAALEVWETEKALEELLFKRWLEVSLAVPLSLRPPPSEAKGDTGNPGRARNSCRAAGAAGSWAPRYKDLSESLACQTKTSQVTPTTFPQRAGHGPFGNRGTYIFRDQQYALLCASSVPDPSQVLAEWGLSRRRFPGLLKGVFLLLLSEPKQEGRLDQVPSRLLLASYYPWDNPIHQMLEHSTREEALRAQHQAALLRLREKALEEKISAERAWLEHQRVYLGSKGDSVALMTLTEMQQQVLSNLEQEQREIRYLRNSHLSWHRERTLLLQCHRDVLSVQRSMARLQRELQAATRQPQSSGPEVKAAWERGSETRRQPEGPAQGFSRPLTPQRTGSPTSHHPWRSPERTQVPLLVAEQQDGTSPRATSASEDHLRLLRPAWGEETPTPDGHRDSQRELLESGSPICQGDSQTNASPLSAEEETRTLTDSHAGSVQGKSRHSQGGGGPCSPWETSQVFESSPSQMGAKLGLDFASSPVGEAPQMESLWLEEQRTVTCWQEELYDPSSWQEDVQLTTCPGPAAAEEATPTLPQLAAPLARGSLSKSAPGTFSGSSEGSRAPSSVGDLSCSSLQEFQKVSAFLVQLSESSISLSDGEAGDTPDTDLGCWSGASSARDSRGLCQGRGQETWERSARNGASPLHGSCSVSGAGPESEPGLQQAGWPSPLPDIPSPRLGSELSEASTEVWDEDSLLEPGAGAQSTTGHSLPAEGSSDLENGGVSCPARLSLGPHGVQEASGTSGSLTSGSDAGQANGTSPAAACVACPSCSSSPRDVDLSLPKGVGFSKGGETGPPQASAGCPKEPWSADLSPPTNRKPMQAPPGVSPVLEGAWPSLGSGVLPEILSPVDEVLSYGSADLPSSTHRDAYPPPPLPTLPADRRATPSAHSKDFSSPPEEAMSPGGSSGPPEEDASINTCELPSLSEEGTPEALSLEPQGSNLCLGAGGPDGSPRDQLGGSTSVGGNEGVRAQWSEPGGCCAGLPGTDGAGVVDLVSTQLTRQILCDTLAVLSELAPSGSR
ncbi:coiled-coil domain-containing protein 187 [Rhynchonycteris naso]